MCIPKTLGASSGLESKINMLSLYMPFMLEALPPPCTTPWLFVFTKKKLKSAAAQVEISDHQRSLYENIYFKAPHRTKFQLDFTARRGQQEKLYVHHSET